MRLASPIREYLPQESSNTTIRSRAPTRTCMTRQRPASLMKPVFDTEMSHFGLRTSPLVLR